MYLAVLAAIAGQALILSRPALLLYAAAVGAGVGAFVRWYEEPTLTRRYGASYPAHQRAVPGWLPRPCPAELIAAAARLRARRRAAAFMIAETRCGPDNTELP